MPDPQNPQQPRTIVARLTKFKELLHADLITQADYDAAKAKALGL